MNESEYDSGRRFVALFIDWDNLAISTSADMAGAVPDVAKIVKKAREYGTILLARAYAEWSVTSERLNVYRAGVEPAYAPTFRFEPDPSAPTIRSKSLADPCMVADAVETLHLMPMITDYVIVTGDKDMIPVVRLVQLRGKRVTVIGPDFVANVLREMTDNFVPYRSLIDEAEVKPAIAPARERPSRPERPLGEPIAEARRLSRGQTRQPEAQPAPQPARPAGRPEPVQRELPSRTEIGRDSRRHVPPPPAAPAPPPIAEPVVMLEPAPLPRPATPVRVEGPASGQGPELESLFNEIADLLQRRLAEGKSRVRATAIKDALLQAHPGFNERSYGFSKFKDLLDAAQRAGLVNIIRVGPVHWATLSSRPAGPATAQPVGEPTSPGLTLEAPVLAPSQAAGTQPPLSEARAIELINFIRDLGNRSRWLTYTFILTNLSTQLGQTKSAAEAEAEARDLLASMVQEGMLQVDTEPREVDVNGSRHRIRMCHLVDTHPLVARALAERPMEQEPGVAGEPIAAAEPLSPEEEARQTTPEGADLELLQTLAGSGAPADEGEKGALAAGEPGSPRRGRSRRRNTRGRGRDATAAAPDEAGTEGAVLAASPEEEIESPLPVAQSWEQASSASGQITPSAEQEVGLPAAAAEVMGEPGAREEAEPVEGEAAATPPTRDAAFAEVGRLVRENTTPARPRLRATGLKQRMLRSLGHFDERDYGFRRFGDFLEAAGNAGVVTLQREGPVVWVSAAGGE